jgi:hypothetical protein
MRDILRNRRQDPIPRSGAAWSARGETPTDPPSPVTATSPTAMARRAAARISGSSRARSVPPNRRRWRAQWARSKAAGRPRGEAIAPSDAVAAHYRVSGSISCQRYDEDGRADA